MTKRINAMDVARLAGVSKTAVSRAFSTESSISADKKNRIIEAARKLGYRPNALARSLRTTRSKLVGIILEEFTNPIFLSILELLTQKLQENGLHALIFNAAKDMTVAEAMELTMQYRIEGLIVTSDIPLAVEYECAAMNVPVIVFARSERRIAGTFGICLDDEAAGRLAARHLMEQGYRKPAFVGGFPGVSVSVDRQRGFTDGLAEFGLRPVAIEYAGENTYDLGLTAGRRLLSDPSRLDSVFCVNDQVAIGVVDAATQRNLSVPNDLGVIGVDNIWISRTARCDLSTIAQPLEQMATKIVEVILASEEATAPRGRSLLFEGTLVPRGSTRRIQAH